MSRLSEIKKRFQRSPYLYEATYAGYTLDELIEMRVWFEDRVTYPEMVKQHVEIKKENSKLRSEISWLRSQLEEVLAPKEGPEDVHPDQS